MQIILQIILNMSKQDSNKCRYSMLQRYHFNYICRYEAAIASIYVNNNINLMNCRWNILN